MTRIFSLIFLLLATPCYAVDYTADANCQAAWLMDANEDPITDSSQNTNTGAAAGDPTWSNADPPAAYSTGYWILDGVTDRFDVTDHASLDIGNADFSIVAWIHMTTYGDSDYGRILDKWDNNNGYSFYVDDAAISDGLSTNIENDGQSIAHSDASVIATGSWYHVAMVFDESANTVYYYVNGIAAGSDTCNDYPAANALVVTIGDRNDNARQFNGRLDEIALFDRTLSGAEVLDIKNNGLGAAAAPTGDSQVILITQE